MANSLMQIVSDGSLSTIPLTIKFFEQSHIKVFVNNVELPDGTYTFAWSGATTLTITPPVALGAEVSIRRKTPADEVLHDFQAGAVFSEVSVDENFRQELFLLQEASEQSLVTDLFDDLDMHGNKVRNLGVAVLPGDAINLAQAQLLADGGEASTLRADLLSSSGGMQVGTPSGKVTERLDGIDSLMLHTSPERFGGVSGTSGLDNAAAIAAAIAAPPKSTVLRGLYDVSTQVTVATKESLVGQGNDTGLVWQGGAGTPGEAVLRVAAADPNTTALNGVLVKDFMVDMSLATGLVGVNMLYASVQSELDGILVTQVGAGSVGFRLGKEWYARTRKCSVRNAGRTGTAVLVDTTVGQVNSVPLDFQINGADVGFDLDTSGSYIYNLDIPATAHAENCAIGLRVKSGYGIRSGVIRGYFENNAVDVVWGTPGATPLDKTQTIVWLGASFNAAGSIVKLYEGNHVFIGCDRIVTLEVHENASVEILCSGVNNIINTTGDPNRVRNRPTPSTVLASSIYGNTALLPGREYNEGISGSATSAVFNSTSKIFSATVPANGRSARCTVTARRTYENTVKFLEFVLVQSSGGTWSYTLTGGVADINWSIAVNSTTGAITVTDNRGDTKVYTLTASPM